MWRDNVQQTEMGRDGILVGLVVLILAVLCIAARSLPENPVEALPMSTEQQL